MTAKNDITGDSIITKPSKKYEENYDSVSWWKPVEEAPENQVVTAKSKTGNEFRLIRKGDTWFSEDGLMEFCGTVVEWKWR